MVRFDSSGGVQQHMRSIAIKSESNRFSVHQLPKGRRTVVDLLTVVGGSAVAGHMVMDIDMTWATQQLSRLKRLGHRVTVTSILLKAIGLAQQSHPLSRTEMISSNKTVTYHNIVGGITIERALDNQPIVFFGEIDSPNAKSIVEIAAALKEYTEISIEKSPPLALQTLFAHFPWFIRQPILALAKCLPALRLKCQRATFGLTTLGKYGVSSILSPCICTSTFAVGSIEDRLVVRNQEIAICPSMTLSYNFDQRVLDPMSAGKFVCEVRMLLEGGMENCL
jgi:pyruvate/2-oxoglutarate dehydrogenase complex dihydrolipoamide acyltransferase (E2) component